MAAYRRDPPGVVRFKRGKISELMDVIGVDWESLAESQRRVAARADAGEPILRAEDARLRKAVFKAMIGEEWVDHRSGRYNTMRAQLHDLFRSIRA